MSTQQRQKNPDKLCNQIGFTLRAAWWTYVVLLILPFMLIAVVVALMNTGISPTPSHGMKRWLLLSTAFLVVGVPAALFYRRRLCGAYFRGDAVPPRQYFAGMLAVWLALEVGMILSVIGCYVTASFLPDLLPAIVAFVFFVTLWPTGKMMVTHVGNSNDAQIYEEPR
jgi:hypothetical protein